MDKLLSTQLSSRLLSLARFITLAWMVFAIVITVISLPAHYQRLFSFSPGDVTGDPFFGWTREQIRVIATSQNISPELYAVARLSASLITLLCFWAVAGVLYWRNSRTWTGLLAAYILFFTGQGFSFFKLSLTDLPEWIIVISNVLAFVAWPTFFIMMYVFPNGKFIPRSSRILAILLYPLALFIILNPDLAPYGFPVLIVYLLGGLASQVYRYRKVSTFEERQQTKWVVLALAIVVIYSLESFVPQTLFPGWVIGSAGMFWNDFISNAIMAPLVWAVLPAGIGISLLKYRLWDVDLVIRRTIMYTLLSGMLGLVYFGGVALLQGILTADRRLPTAGEPADSSLTLSTTPSAVVIVVTTLAIAALANPLRRRLQETIDRRFYRQKYDAEKALADFAAAARSETDLPALTGSLVSVVQDTVQPEQVNLWLRGAEKPKARYEK